MLLAVLSLVLPLPAFGYSSAVGSRMMVASSNRIASEVGVAVMSKGGNAVDAACAVALALAVVHPAAGNLGGGGFMLIRMSNGRSTAIDYRESAPLAASRDMYLDASGNVIPGRSLAGYKACGVPGTVAGLALAHEKFGKLPWREVVQPAADLAEKGFVLSQGLANDLRSTTLSHFPESRRIFQRDGNYYRAGELFQQPDLAKTLVRIAANGPNEFYRGETARLIAEAMRQGGGLIGLADLAGYRPAERKPLTGSYRGYQVLTMPPPSSGGIALLEMLNILEPRDLGGTGADQVETDHLLIESMRRAFADRAEFLGDPDFVKVPVGGLISKPYAELVAKTIQPSAASKSSEIGHGSPPGYESNETTHFSVVDAYGNAVSNTYTLNFGFGSGVTIPGAGFLMNDEMDDFTSKVGVPNGFGLIQGSANAIAPRKRPLSSMTPTIVTQGGKLFLVLGSPGGPTIITTVLQVLSNVIDHGMSVTEAVGAPRIHHQWLPDDVQIEKEAMPATVYAALIANGYRLRRVGRWGDAEAIEVDPVTGMLTGASDPRSPDAAALGG
jgi:gamma-glutamyltranspeptidase/glutathione hydrolase